jgi:hypothetical protein
LELEGDRAAVVAGLRRAVADSGLSQAGFARAIGTSASRFSTYLTGGTVPSASLYLRAIRLGRALKDAEQRSWLTPIVAIGGVREALADGDRSWALRLVLQCRDHLRRVLDTDRRLGAAWEADPGSTDFEEWDRLLAALIGHEFETRELSAPAWTGRTAAGDPRLFGSPFFTADEVRAATPSWLIERGIFIAARDLTTA